MIGIQKAPNTRVLEIGGGDNPNPASDWNVDVRPGPKVNQVIDLNKLPLPLADGEWDLVLAVFVLEYVGYRCVRDLLKEIRRVTKPGGKFLGIVPNTSAQMEWISTHPEGWDGRDFFDSASGKLFGDQDYPENSHRSFWNHTIAVQLFTQAGFVNIQTAAFGARSTDLLVEATRPNEAPSVVVSQPSEEVKKEAARLASPEPVPTKMDYAPAVWFDKYYFDGGRKIGGYTQEGYRDFPVHHIVYENLKRLERNVESVLELGCARGYLVKRFQDDGVRACGLDVSKHCFLSRACNGILEWDITRTPWPWKNKEFDLCYGVSVLEHVPEEYLEAIVTEMQRVAKRFLFAISPRESDQDRTNVTARPIDWWENKLNSHLREEGKNKPSLAVMDVKELYQGAFPKRLLEDGGKVKLNLGSFLTMFHHGWNNLDVLDMGMFASQNGYRFIRHDLRQNLPFDTGSVDLVYSSFVLNHFDYQEGLASLRDCRRILKPNGAMRVLVPDAGMLIHKHLEGKMDEFAEISGGVEASPTQTMKLWALLYSNSRSSYDAATIQNQMEQAGFSATISEFRSSIDHPGSKQILRETIDMLPCLALVVDATPLVA